jgi:hypothetical protein
LQVRIKNTKFFFIREGWHEAATHSSKHFVSFSWPLGIECSTSNLVRYIRYHYTPKSLVTKP